MPATEHLSRVDAVGQADLVRRTEVSAVELVQVAIARLPLPAGPLAGVPFLLVFASN